MPLFRATLAALAVLLAATPALARPNEVARAIADAESVGQARYGMLAVHLFDAELWASAGAFSWQRPFALTLTYRRSMRETALINRAISEMSQRGGGSAGALAPLRAQFAQCFSDVRPGDRFTGVSTGPNTARFFFNGAQRCDVEWPGFRRSFFGIWLAGRDGPAARLSAQLRGEA